MKTTRVRFAPSPTGHLHIGSLRTALFNWLYARSVGGDFLVRIEDTDTQRSSIAYTESILKALEWVGITSDEPIVYQTRRMDLYKETVERLLIEKKAYRCFCVQERVEHDASGHRYDGACRNRIAQSDDALKPHAIRFALPIFEEISFTDAIRGIITFKADQFDDFVIVRSDGIPLYNFVVVVDDIDMRITHVIRGEDHITNTPKQILLYQALNAALPEFAHMPLILGASGQRLSKRDAATSVWEYQQLGYLADALCNYLMRLGWSWNDKEIFTKESVGNAFQLKDIHKSGAIFDQAKLDWINNVYLKQMEAVHIDALIRSVFDTAATLFEGKQEMVIPLIDIYKERSATLKELFATIAAVLYWPQRFEKNDQINTALITHCIEQINASTVYNHDTLKNILHDIAQTSQVPFSTVAQQLRFMLTGSLQGPGIIAILCALGKEESMARLRLLSAQA